MPDLYPAKSGSRSGFAGSLPGQIRVEIRFHRISTRQYPGLDPVLPGLYPAKSGSGSGFTGSLPGKIRIWIRFRRISTRQNPDLDPVAARLRVLHGLSYPVQALHPGITLIHQIYAPATNRNRKVVNQLKLLQQVVNSHCKPYITSIARIQGLLYSSALVADSVATF